MATVSSATKYFPTAKEGFTTTLASTISSGAVTVPLNSVSGFSNGETVVLVIEPTSATKKQAFTGVVDTSGVQITNVVWTEGSNDSHTAGVTVVDYETATHWALYSKGLLVEHNQDGTHSDITATTVTADEFIVTGSAGANNGWEVGLPTPDTVTYNGNRSYDLVFNSNDLTDTLSNGMRVRATRTVTAPTQCADLESGSSQYFSKSSPAGTTFTDDFNAGAWIKLESYGTICMIVSRYNGTSGWSFYINADGTVGLQGNNAASGNYSKVTSYQSVPLNKWVHVAAQLDMSAFTATTTTSYVMIDGVDVPSAVSRAGTNPTALVQAGNLEVGGWNGGLLPFDGKLAQVWYSSAKITQANIKTFISQGMSGSETSIVSCYSFNNSINDLNANANNLTANGGALATATDSPFSGGATGTTEYGIITANSFSTNTTLTVQVPEGYAIPTSGGVSAVAYSTQDVPYGFPRNKGKWAVIAIDTNDLATAATSLTSLVENITIPIGPWRLSVRGNLELTSTSTASRNGLITLSSDAATVTHLDLGVYIAIAEPQYASGSLIHSHTAQAEGDITLTSATTFTVMGIVSGAAATVRLRASSAIPTYITADFAYI